MQKPVPKPEWGSTSPFSPSQLKPWIIWDPPAELGIDKERIIEIVTMQINFQIDTMEREIQVLKSINQAIKG